MVKPSPKSTGMSLRTILIHPDPRLKKVADPVARVTPEIESLAADLLASIASRAQQCQCVEFGGGVRALCEICNSQHFLRHANVDYLFIFVLFNI